MIFGFPRVVYFGALKALKNHVSKPRDQFFEIKNSQNIVMSDYRRANRRKLTLCEKKFKDHLKKMQNAGRRNTFEFLRPEMCKDPLSNTMLAMAK